MNNYLEHLKELGKMEEYIAHHKAMGESVAFIAEKFGISRQSVYNNLESYKKKLKAKSESKYYE